LLCGTSWPHSPQTDDPDRRDAAMRWRFTRTSSALAASEMSRILLTRVSMCAA